MIAKVDQHFYKSNPNTATVKIVNTKEAMLSDLTILYKPLSLTLFNIIILTRDLAMGIDFSESNANIKYVDVMTMEFLLSIWVANIVFSYQSILSSMIIRGDGVKS